MLFSWSVSGCGRPVVAHEVRRSETLTDARRWRGDVAVCAVRTDRVRPDYGLEVGFGVTPAECDARKVGTGQICELQLGAR